MRADGVAADTEFDSASVLFPAAPPDHLLSAPRGEHHPAYVTHQGDDPKGLVMIIENDVSSGDWEVLYTRRMWSALFFHKVFSSTLGKDLILEFSKEMFTMKEFEQVNHLSYIVLSLLLCASPDISSSSGSSSFPPCCALLPACSAPVILYPATLAWMCWSAWSSPKPRPPQMAPWLLKLTRCFSLDRPLGQILRTIFILPTSIPPVLLENVVSHAGVLARRSPAALPISQESQRWCCLWSHLLERGESSLTCHCCGALWCFCHTSGNTHIILCSLCGLMSQFKNCLCSNGGVKGSFIK